VLIPVVVQVLLSQLNTGQWQHICTTDQINLTEANMIPCGIKNYI